MNNLLIKLKEELRNLRKERVTYIKTSRVELFNLSLLIEEIEQEYNKPWYKRKNKTIYNSAVNIGSLKLIEAFNLTGITISNLITKSKKGDKKSFTMLTNIVSKFSDYVAQIETSIKKLQNYINAFGDDKVRMPINDIESLFIELLRTNLSVEEINKVIGMIIFFNKEYFDREKKSINYADKKILDTLYSYYNQDGSFKYNKNADKYLTNIRLLLMKGLGIMEDNTPGVKPARFVSDGTFRILLDLSNTNYEQQPRNPIEAPGIEVTYQPMHRILVQEPKKPV